MNKLSLAATLAQPLTKVLSDSLQGVFVAGVRSHTWGPLSDPLTDSLAGSLWSRLADALNRTRR